MVPEQLLTQVGLIQAVMAKVMLDGQHYGVIPGTGDKPSLLKPGAEKLCMTFRLRPLIGANDIEIVDFEGGHREYRVTCHIMTQDGDELATGLGSCSTLETRYRFRKAEQACPECGKATIIKGKKEYGGGWLCWAKKGGCGSKFGDGDERIENQNMGRVEHDNPSDYWNTCLKMAKKRAFVDGTLTATAASDMFTQDVEDMHFAGATSPPHPEPTRRQESRRQEPQRASRTSQPSAEDLAAYEQQFGDDDCSGPTPSEELDQPDLYDESQQGGPADGEVFEVTGCRVKKTGTGKNGEWKLYGIKLDGKEYTTFDSKVAMVAQDAIDKGAQVAAEFKQEGKYLNLTRLTIIDNDNDYDMPF
jgi:hypothetical protein